MPDRGESVFPVANCAGCRARVIWATVNPELKSAQRTMFAATPHPEGDYVLARDTSMPRDKHGAVQIRATKIRRGQRAGMAGDGWVFYALHTPSCPKRDELRTKYAAAHAKGGRR
ncbi:hypothetical protein TPB0596_12030 [Tsukamurella pulmonis]|uniref:hypothetical protein n=1 Tax=Tsukamurella pulmonis TaxID=47312 RepID=UPI001EDF1428|nr:hypothetical protein [Tsukamurella pulmonis]BDD81440.1 hypothetical protein TPB0596_12030 [Tsukamurella pulmonis]